MANRNARTPTIRVNSPELKRLRYLASVIEARVELRLATHPWMLQFQVEREIRTCSLVPETLHKEQLYFYMNFDISYAFIVAHRKRFLMIFSKTKFYKFGRVFFCFLVCLFFVGGCFLFFFFFFFFLLFFFFCVFVFSFF